MLFKRPNTSIRAHFVPWIQPSIFIHLSKLPRHLFALSVALVHWRVSATANESGRNEIRSRKLWITLKISYSPFDFFPSSFSLLSSSSTSTSSQLWAQFNLLFSRRRSTLRRMGERWEKEVCEKNEMSNVESCMEKTLNSPLSTINLERVNASRQEEEEEVEKKEIIKFQQVPSIKINKGFAWCLSSLFVRMYEYSPCCIHFTPPSASSFEWMRFNSTLACHNNSIASPTFIELCSLSSMFLALF